MGQYKTDYKVIDKRVRKLRQKQDSSQEQLATKAVIISVYRTHPAEASF